MTSVAVTESPVRVHGRFVRSVQLERDWDDQRALSDYLITPTVRDLTERIVSELQRPGGTRAWSVTGPYGTGKSAFALFLTRFLANRLEGNAEAIALRERLSFHTEFAPVLVVGRRAPLKPVLLSALADALSAIGPELAREARELAASAQIDAREVATLYERAASEVSESGLRGLVVVIDEFGKLLEYVSANLDTEDLLVMQELAEGAARSKAPLVLATILHSSFAAYIDGANQVQQAEWQKVQGRFADVAFQEPPEQVLRLVGAALDFRFTAAPSAKMYQETVRLVSQEPALGEARRRLPIEELLPACLPLDPITALILSPLFRGKLAQNERSLFSFLTSDEPLGFQEFVRHADWERDPPPVFRLPRLFDYVSHSLGVGMYRGDLARRWVEVDDALDRIGADAPLLAADVVKCIGLLWMYGAPVGLRASEDVIRVALGEASGVETALAYLQKRSVVIYRRFEDAFALWEGSDVNLDDRYAEALAHVGRGNLAERLEKAVKIHPLVARAHYIAKGTLRYFDVRVVDGDESRLRLELDRPAEPADGRIVFVLSASSRARADLVQAALRLTSSESRGDKLRIVAFPKPLAGLEGALKDFEAWQWVKNNTPALAGDQVAMRELSGLLRYAEMRVEAIAGNVLGLRGHRFEPWNSEWIQGGARHDISDSKDLIKWLSRLCDEIFHLAPAFHNELLNRSDPSSAANSALYKLVKAMVSSGHRKRLGIEGMPPEMSMYESMLRRGQFHRFDEIRGHWWLGEPDGTWQPVWQEIERFLGETHSGRQSISALYDRLKQPPFGLRQGPMPVLLTAALLAKRTSVGIYQDGLFQPRLTEQLAEQIARNPDQFEVQEFVLDDQTRSLLSTMADVVRALDTSVPADDDSPLLAAARPLILLAARLPRYSQNTRHIEPEEALELREALKKTRDPHTLLLQDVPRILDVDPADAQGRQELARKLEAALLGLLRAYPDLLDSIESQVKQAFSVTELSSRGVQAALAKRAASLQGLVADPALVAFVQRAVHTPAEEDWREAVGLVVVQGRAPKDWTDADRSIFQARLQQLASDFKRVEELAHEKKRAGASTVLRIGVLGSAAEEVRQLVSLEPDDEEEVTRLADSMNKLVLEYSGGSRSEKLSRIAVAALSRLLMQRLREGEGKS